MSVDSFIETKEAISVAPQDYQTLEKVSGMTDKDIKEIMTLGDLSTRFSSAGEIIHKIIRSFGKVQVQVLKKTNNLHNEEKFVDTSWILQGETGDHKVVAITNKNAVSVDIYSTGKQQTKLYGFTLPIGKEYKSTGNALQDNMYLHAQDWRGGAGVSFNPAQEPANTTVQQGFAAVVKEGLGALLNIAPKPVM